MKVGLFFIHSGNKLSDKGKPAITLSRLIRMSETYQNTPYFRCRAAMVDKMPMAAGIFNDLP